MDDYSYDGTEQTPQPKQYRPPPMQPLSSTRSGARQNLRSTQSHHQQQQQHCHQPKSAFSFDINSYGMDETLTSIPAEPPSPMSRLTGSLMEDKVGMTPSRKARRTRNSSYGRPSVHLEKPPVPEVRVETSDSSSYFDCLGSDDGLAARAKRTLRLPTPKHQSVEVASSTASSAMEDVEEEGDADPSSRDVSRVHESALQALLQMKEELAKCVQRNKALVQENYILQSQANDRESKWDAELQRLRESVDTLRQTKSLLEKKVATLEDEKKQIQEEADTNARAAARREKESKHRLLTNDNRIKQLEQNLKFAKKQLEEKTQQQTKLAEDLTSVSQDKSALKEENEKIKEELWALKNDREKDNTVMRLEKEVGAKDSRITKLANQLDEIQQGREQEMQGLRGELEDWKQRYQDKCDEYRAMIGRAKTPVAKNGATVRFQEPGSPIESSVADRLARMRDSAERAHLIKSHKRELARLKLNYDDKIQKLLTSHQDTLRKAQKKAETDFASRLEEMRRTVQEEYDEKARETEELQRERFAELQKELMRSQEASDESLQEALARISHITQQYEREVTRRASLELNINELNHHLEQSRRDMRKQHAEELEKRQKQWEVERDTLLTLVQSECNSAFEQHRRSLPSNFTSPSHDSPSPTGVMEEPTSSAKKLAINTSFEEDEGYGSPGSANLVSPAYSEIDNVLRETEDLIQSIM